MNTYEMNRRQALITGGLGALSLNMPGVVIGRDATDKSGCHQSSRYAHQ